MSLRKLSIQIYSDLHLELTKSIPKITPRASKFKEDGLFEIEY